jgi:hypothetical protein
MSNGNPTQELNQKILHEFGWSARFDTNEEGFWFVEIKLGMNDTRMFTSNYQHSSSAPESSSIKDRKKGTAAASKVALEGIKEEIAMQKSKQLMALNQVFPKAIPIYESNEENWNFFWQHKPPMVGIDAEGNQRSPPVLLQVSTEDYAILEAPNRRQGLSKHVKRLLQDNSIVKVFCDNFSHHDKTCLGLAAEPGTYLSGPIVDIEAIAGQLLGPVKVARGLSRIVTLCMPELNVLVRKPKNKLSSVGRFAMIEQGKATPLKSIHDLTKKQQQYAALDAWSTLLAYQRLQEASNV